ncbi:hypothetical protein SmJEL517_g04024 [Synchytrium microbalum]|uniref:Uncharacterized protein n=1 Tax=Synchytrium microbalum TaxID=1806994 RepID=A0A507C4W2_9FUNG|nr:uncharacterized protein SmJEL517_g04024 [Synchytrium microbalum]TPX33026.1 hypothetical protein SmJEL517_g04024 [Synchytrium microbalum]
MIDEDSDHWTLRKCSQDLHDKLFASFGKVQYTDSVAALLAEAHSRGTTPDQIKSYLHAIPFSPSMVKALELMHAQNSDILILSDANTVFIDEILKSRNAKQYITRVISNPAYWRDDGMLVVKRHTTNPPHGCKDKRCGINLCKGKELDAHVAQYGPYDRIVYCGDGANDACPILRLAPKDAVVYRTGRRLEKILNADAQERNPTVKTSIILPFTTGEDALAHFTSILKSR